MLEFLILAGLAFAGYSGAPTWLALPGAAAITLEGWWRKVRLLQQQPKVPFSSKMSTYLIVSIAINVGFATASLLVGRMLKWMLHG